MKISKSNITPKTLLYEVYDYASISSGEAIVKEHLKSVDSLIENRIIPVDSSAFIGIEVEVEGVKNRNGISILNPTWRLLPDGSLRNYGLEFVSVPIRGESIYRSLVLLDNWLAKTNKISFSERTSIHVHMNVRRLTLEQLFVLVLTYLISEKVLFKFIESSGFTRENNIFCTPVTDSKYYLHLDSLFQSWEQKNYSTWLASLRNFWRKYTAFNLLPLVAKGTIEFRHMGGTLDLPILMNWINLILSLKKYCYTTSLEKLLKIVENLNTDSTYFVFLESVFQNYHHLLLEHGTDSRLEDGIKSVKQCIVWSKTIEEQPSFEKFEESSFGRYFKACGGKFLQFSLGELEEKLAKLNKERMELERIYKKDNDPLGIISKQHGILVNEMNKIRSMLNVLKNSPPEETK